jgi:bacterial/archaeal transporter family protein
VSTVVGALALAGRVLMLGAERVVVKRLGARASGVAAAFLFFFIATVCLAPVVVLTGALPLLGRFDLRTVLIIAGNGLVYSGAFVLYVSALSAGEASFVSPFYNFNVAFLLVLAVAFVGEAFTAGKAAGVALLVAGSWLLARPMVRTRVAAGAGAAGPVEGVAAANRRAALLMIGCSLLMAVGRTVDASQVRLPGGAGAGAVGSVAYSFAIYAAVTVWLGIFVGAAGKAGEAVQIVRSRPWTALAAGAINAYSYLLLLVALGSMEVSVAEPASMLSLLVTLVLAGAVFRESIASRILPTLLMIAGAWAVLLG